MEKKKIWLILIFAVLVYSLLIFFADFDKSIEALNNFNWLILPIIFCLAITNYLIRFLKWNYFLKKVDVNLGLKENLFVFFSGLAMVITPGKIGEIWKGWLIRDINGEKLSKTIPVVIVERFTDVTGLLILSIFGVILYYQQGIYLIGIIFILILAFFLIIRSNVIIKKIYTFVEKRSKGYSEDIKTVQTSFNELMEPKGIFIMSMVSAFAWFFECLGLFLVIIGFGESFSIIESSFIYSFSLLAGAVSMIPGGLGITEGSITGLLELFDFSRTISIWSSMIIRIGTIWFGVLFGVIIYFLFRKRFIK
jgi:uncharacterized protein (TIRG00374 family)